MFVSRTARKFRRADIARHLQERTADILAGAAPCRAFIPLNLHLQSQPQPEEDFPSPTNVEAAISPALIINSAGIASYTLLSTSRVLHSKGPQTSQQGLCPVSPPIQSSSGRRLMRIRFDLNGSFLNSATESFSFFSLILIPNGARDRLSAETALSTSFSVEPHLGQVSPLDINRCHLISSNFDSAFFDKPISAASGNP